MSRFRLLALVAVAAAAGCGGGSSNNSTTSTCSCPGGTCDSAGVCILTHPDGGTTVPTCSASDKPVGTSTAPQSQVQHLGSVTVGNSVRFTVPANTQSITLVEQAVNAPDFITFDGTQLDNVAVPLRVLDQAGHTIYDDLSTVVDPVALANQPAFFASSSPATGTFTIPNTTGGLALVGSSGFAPGTWSAVVSDYGFECATGAGIPSGSTCKGGSTTSTYDVTVITKPSASGGGIAANGTIDLHVYFATTMAQPPTGANQPLSAATANAGNDPDVNRMVQTYKQLLAGAGIAVGVVTFEDLPQSVQAMYATGVNVDQTGACAPLAQLLKHAAPGNTMNAFFVSSLEATGLQGNNQVVGIDGTIPGPSTIGGTVASGVAVATGDLRAGRAACGGGFNLSCGADITAYIVAHETGHFLGLYHVTESTGTLFDPLLDTPTCSCQSCAPTASRRSCADSTPAPAPGSAYQVSSADCTASSTCAGGDNLMFWILDRGSKGTLTADQGRVMRANALVQ